MFTALLLTWLLGIGAAQKVYIAPSGSEEWNGNCLDSSCTNASPCRLSSNVTNTILNRECNIVLSNGIYGTLALQFAENFSDDTKLLSLWIEGKVSGLDLAVKGATSLYLSGLRAKTSDIIEGSLVLFETSFSNSTMNFYSVQNLAIIDSQFSLLSNTSLTSVEIDLNNVELSTTPDLTLKLFDHLLTSCLNIAVKSQKQC